MIMPNPDFTPLAPVPSGAAAPGFALAMHMAVLLLQRRNRTQADDAMLLGAARAAQDSAALCGADAEVRAGLLWARTQLDLGRHAAALTASDQVQRLARGTPQAGLTTVRALVIAATAWSQLDNEDHAAHLHLLASLVAESIVHPDARACALGLLTDAELSSSGSN